MHYLCTVASNRNIDISVSLFVDFTVGPIGSDYDFTEPTASHIVYDRIKRHSGLGRVARYGANTDNSVISPGTGNNLGSNYCV